MTAVAWFPAGFNRSTINRTIKAAIGNHTAKTLTMAEGLTENTILNPFGDALVVKNTTVNTVTGKIFGVVYIPVATNIQRRTRPQGQYHVGPSRERVIKNTVFRTDC